jgi:hypothetical protein
MTMVLVPDKKPVKKKEESGEVEATEPVTPE